ncbi:MAG: hypothetical protein D6753_11065 [Planctomycetota bacterium]|nr:MAG: hypothetical protein D6753_11065 [Planctomycetota bacterium]
MTQPSETVPWELSVRELRRRWKPTRLRLQQVARGGEQHPLPIRIHRAISWLEAAERENDGDRIDERLLLLWIGLNALYSRWNAQQREPVGDRSALKQFLTQILHIDHNHRVAGLLQHQRELIEEILADKYTNSYHWSTDRGGPDDGNDRARYLAAQWYQQGDWPRLLSETVHRIYFLRCQLVHGAATHGGNLNRQAVARSVRLLDPMLRTLLCVVIDGGVAVDWGELCYPPVKR